MVPAPGQLDSRIEIVTPENITFRYQLGGPFRRLLAYLVDLAIRVVVLVMAGLCLIMFFDTLGVVGIGVGIALVLWFVLDWLYGGLFETFWNGQTPGKRLLGLRVLTVDGQPIDAMQAILRNVLRAADAMPILLSSAIPLYGLGLAAMFFSPRFQRLGDLACGTIVVAEGRRRLLGVARITDTAVIDLAQSLPTGFPVSRGLAGALSAYLARRSGFGPGRRAEIARILGEPLSARFNLPPGTVNYDLLLMALYYRTFIADRGASNGQEAPRPTDVPALVGSLSTGDVSPTGVRHE